VPRISWCAFPRVWMAFHCPRDIRKTPNCKARPRKGPRRSWLPSPTRNGMELCHYPTVHWETSSVQRRTRPTRQLSLLPSYIASTFHILANRFIRQPALIPIQKPFRQEARSRRVLSSRPPRQYPRASPPCSRRQLALFRVPERHPTPNRGLPTPP
jgi:hypothetical protein